MKVKQRIVNRANRKIVKPDPKPRHPDLIGADAALRRAARRALNLALQTGTSCWILRDGEMVDLAAEVRGRSRAKAVIAAIRRPSSLASQRKAGKHRTAGFDAAAVERAWRAFQRDIDVAPIYSARQYDKMVGLMNQIIDAGGGNERHSLAGLLDLVGELVMAYESRVLPEPDASGRKI